MTDPIISDDALRAAQLALDGLSRRQEIIGHNLANVDTPGYQAQQVNFESALQRALQGGADVQIEKTNRAHLSASSGQSAYRVSQRQGGSARADGNDVDIDVELMQMTETNLRYETLAQLIGKKFSLLREIASRR